MPLSLWHTHLHLWVNFLFTSGGAPLLYEKSNNAKCGVTRVRHSLNNVCILFDSRPHTLVEEGLENHLHMEKVD